MSLIFCMDESNDWKLVNTLCMTQLELHCSLIFDDQTIYLHIYIGVDQSKPPIEIRSVGTRSLLFRLSRYWTTWIRTVIKILHLLLSLLFINFNPLSRSIRNAVLCSCSLQDLQIPMEHVFTIYYFNNESRGNALCIYKWHTMVTTVLSFL